MSNEEKITDMLARASKYIGLAAVEAKPRDRQRLDFAQDQVLGALNELRTEPSTWSLTSEPRPEVTRLWDASGDEWVRRADGDWDLNVDDTSGYEFDHANWLLLLTLGPLSAASPLSDKKGASGE